MKTTRRGSARRSAARRRGAPHRVAPAGARRCGWGSATTQVSMSHFDETGRVLRVRSGFWALYHDTIQGGENQTAGRRDCMLPTADPRSVSLTPLDLRDVVRIFLTVNAKHLRSVYSHLVCACRCVTTTRLGSAYPKPAPLATEKTLHARCNLPCDQGAQLRLVAPV